MWQSCVAGLVWIALMAPTVGLADDRPVDLLSEGDPSVSPDGTVTAGDPCDALTVHEPAPDVAYQPGVDAEGNPVAPAELDGGSPSLLGPDHEYSVNLTMPLSEVTDTSPGTGAERVADSDFNVGRITVRDNKVYFDGQLIGDQSAHALAQACAMRQAEAAK